MIDPAKKS